MTRLLEQYKKTISSELKTKFSYKNVHEVPKIKKIVFNKFSTNQIEKPCTVSRYVSIDSHVQNKSLCVLCNAHPTSNHCLNGL